MIRCVVNNFSEQVIKDEDFIGMEHNSLTEFELVTMFVLKARVKEKGIRDMIDIRKAKDMAPYFNNYLIEAEKVLGKKREFFTESERKRCIDEFTEIYDSAVKMLEDSSFNIFN